ncbi:MAG TPA: AlkA N-terminal domain-containing protein [Gemmatimonadaceae bacterium]|nr:AlkA N-terminal domain-containing protein [Gemmatimonadaceae bacterium]
MTPDIDTLYTAFAAHDPRFDGVFYVGVTSTGIYCRPVCTARTPKAANCRFFDSAVAAEKANFRPCLRCRPELAPGNAPVDDAHRIASLIAHRIDEGMLDDGAGLEIIAARFGWSSRQIRRMLQRELGVSPMDLVLTRRLLLAKQLLTETTLPVSEVAFASGFSSVRRFNDAFNSRYGIPPTQFRKATPNARRTASDVFTLQLGYRPPLDWAELLAFLAARGMLGVEAIEGGAYRRTVQLGTHVGWVSVRHAPDTRALLVELPYSLTPVLPALLGRLRHLFDLSARPDVISAHLAPDPLLADSVARHPGLRVPGAFDGFELAVRAILGQQITVKAATTIAGRFAQALGERVDTPHAGLDRLAPTADRVARTRASDVAALGIVRARAESIVALAREMAAGRLVLEPGGKPDESIARLTALPGVGPWTAQYIAMRATRWPDAFPKEDIAARKALGGVSAAAADAASQAWRPWRSYALLHLWQTTSRS